jgi:heme/copper-type cytochrome/quinol oxidase subunit 2
MRKAPLFSTTLAGLLVLAGCAASTSEPVTPPPDQTTPPATDSMSSASMMDQTSSAAMMDATSSAPAAADNASKGSQARVIDMTATDWSFTPNVIQAKVGEKVIVHLKGVSGQHSFAIPDLGINVAINPGETKDIEIPTDKAGTFTFRCFVPCGPGHKDMTGQLVVN